MINQQKDFDSKYRYVLVAARRARQLQSGAPALITSTTRKAAKLAQDEIRAGKVEYIATRKSTAPLTAAADFFDGGSR